MLEYKVFHKKSLGKARRPHAARRKGKEKVGPPAASLLSAAMPVAAVLLSLVLVGAAGAGIYAWLGRSPLFAVRDIDLNPCAHVSRDEVAAILSGVTGGNIGRLSTAEIGRRLLDHPFVRQVSVRKVFPDRLVVRVVERIPVAMINLDALYYVDDQGAVFKRLTAYDAKTFPIVTGFSRTDLAAKEPFALGNLKRTIDLLRRAESGSLRRNISEVHFDPLDGYTIVTRDQGLRLKIGTTEFAEAMRRVDEAMPKLAGLGRDVGVVDLKTEGRIYVRPGD